MHNQGTRPRRADASELSAARAGRILWRGMRLRCPHCGSRGILDGWFKLKHRCPSCGLVLDRGESDYFLGAYLVNLVAVELILTAIMSRSTCSPRVGLVGSTSSPTACCRLNSERRRWASPFVLAEAQ